MAFGAMIVLLTALRSWASFVFVSPALIYLLGTAVVVGTIYWALRGI
jgi:hypothetical protein